MDYFLHLRRKEEESDVETDASEESEEMRNDIESRLYSIVHHNDLTQPLPPEIQEMYSVEHNELGEVIVSLKEKLRDTNIQINNHNAETNASDISVNGNSIDFQTKPYYSKAKRVRYSDMVLDEPKDFPVIGNSIRNLNNSDLLSIIDWKKNSKLDFIPVDETGQTKLNSESDFENIFSEILEAQPNISVSKLRNLLSGIAKKQRNGELGFLTTRDVFKNNRKFFFKRSNFKRSKKKNKTVNNTVLYTQEQLYSQNCILNSQEVGNSEIIEDDCEIIQVVKTNVKHTDKDKQNAIGKQLVRQNEFNRFVRRVIKQHPSWSVEKIKEKLKKNGIYYNEEMLSSMKIISSTEKLPVGGPLITNVIEPGSYNTSSIPLIVIDNSDEESNNISTNIETNLNSIMGNIQVHNESNSESVVMPLLCPPYKWTKEMIKFYDNESERLKNFDHIKIKNQLRRQGSNSEDWKLNMDEANRNDRRRDQNIRCINCFRFGHAAFGCKNPKRKTLCVVCGDLGHKVFSCPYKMCLNCGEKSNSYCSICTKCRDYTFLGFVCEICGSSSHAKELCTDLWRCYHSTTSSGPIINTVQTPNIRKCCSFCSKEGHFAHECKMDNFRTKVSSSFVKNHNPLEQLTSDGGQISQEIPCYRDILIPPHLYDKIIHSSKGIKFLKHLSCKHKSPIDTAPSNCGSDSVVRVFGTTQQWNNINKAIVNWGSFLSEENKISGKKKRRKHKKNIVQINL